MHRNRTERYIWLNYENVLGNPAPRLARNWRRTPATLCGPLPHTPVFARFHPATSDEVQPTHASSLTIMGKDKVLNGKLRTEVSSSKMLHPSI